LLTACPGYVKCDVLSTKLECRFQKVKYYDEKLAPLISEKLFLTQAFVPVFCFLLRLAKDGVRQGLIGRGRIGLKTAAAR